MLTVQTHFACACYVGLCLLSPPLLSPATPASHLPVEFSRKRQSELAFPSQKKKITILERTHNKCPLSQLPQTKIFSEDPSCGGESSSKDFVCHFPPMVSLTNKSLPPIVQPGMASWDGHVESSCIIHDGTRRFCFEGLFLYYIALSFMTLRLSIVRRLLGHVLLQTLRIRI